MRYDETVDVLSPHNARTMVADAEAGRVVCTPRRPAVAILGAGRIGREATPWDDEGWEVWSCNRLPARDPEGRVRVDRWFELHPRRAQTEDDLDWMRRCPVPLYTLEREPDCPQSVVYPLAEVCELFGGPTRPYFTCTFAYQIALAILERFTRIGLFGVSLEMGTPRERTVERACVETWLAFAAGAGITVTVPSETSMLRHPWLYGYHYEAERDGVAKMMDVLAGLRERELARLAHVGNLP